MFYVPVYQSYQKQDDLVYQNVKQAVTQFVDNVRTKGYITPKMYEDFQNEISVGTYLFRTDIVHEQKSIHLFIRTPIYSQEIIPLIMTSIIGIKLKSFYLTKRM